MGPLMDFKGAEQEKRQQAFTSKPSKTKEAFLG
jgi:hypothetical protein